MLSVSNRNPRCDPKVFRDKGWGHCHYYNTNKTWLQGFLFPSGIMSSKDCTANGYLDVKISAKVKRGFTPWKAWKKHWCELKRIDNIDNGIEITLRHTVDSNSGANCFIIPRNATLCRTESRSKQYSFGIFINDRSRNHKPLLFLSGSSESDTQTWIRSIRMMLSISTYLPVPNGNFYISIIDNNHSRAAGLTGLHGILTTNSHGLIIRDPVQGRTQATIPWQQLLQFHLAAPDLMEDERKIVILHTNREFRSDAGQLHFYCTNAPGLLNCLVRRGKTLLIIDDIVPGPATAPALPRIRISLLDTRRLSRSEGDLRDTNLPDDGMESPVCHFRTCSESDDSGVRVSVASDDSTSGTPLHKYKNDLSCPNLRPYLFSATPGGSEIDSESTSDLVALLENDKEDEEEQEEESVFTDFIQFSNHNYPEEMRRESGVSITSGVYEEILEPSSSIIPIKRQSFSLHMYEDPVDVILNSSTQRFTPPPLPPRRDLRPQDSFNDDLDVEYSLKKKKQSFETETDYMVMASPTVVNKIPAENQYVPMSSSKVNENQTEEESSYMIMTGNRIK